MAPTLGPWRGLVAAITPVTVLGTLICCALPIALVAVGAGTVVASLVSAAPWLAALTRHKAWLFLVAGVLLVVNYWMLYRSRGSACRPAGVCHATHPIGRLLRRVWWMAVGLYGVGFAAAYLLLPFGRMLG